MYMAPVLPPVPSPLRSQPTNAASSSGSRLYTAGTYYAPGETSCSRGSNQQQLIQQQQQLQQQPQQQQLLSAQSTNLAPLQAGMAAPYVSASGLIKPPADMPAASNVLLYSKPSSVPAAAGGLLLAPVSSRQGSINSSFFDADSVFETGCTSRDSFLLPEDLEDAPFSSTAAPGLMMSSPSAAAAAASAGTSSKWLSGINTPTAPRSPLVSASTVAALMEDDSTPNMDLLSLDGHLGVPGHSPFGCQLLDADASDQLLSLCDPAATPAVATDVTGLFDTPEANSGSNAVADTAAVGVLSNPPRRGMVSLTASMAASAVLRRGQQHDSSSHSHTSSTGQVAAVPGSQQPQQQQQQQQMYTLVLLDGSTGAPMTAAAGARDAEQLSMMIGNSPTKASAMPGVFAATYGYAGTGAVGKKAAAGAAAAVLDDTFSAAAAGAAARGHGSSRGRPGRPKGNVGRPSNASKAAAAAAAKAAAAAASAAAIGLHGGVDSQCIVGGGSADVTAATLEMIPVMNSSNRRSSEAGENLGLLDPAAAAAAVTCADSGSGGDSSNESGTQQQDVASKGPVVVPVVHAPAAAGGASKSAQRQFHHKGGGPCDHCGVLESPQWRRGPPAKPILCNACGTRYRRTHNLGPPIPSSGRPGGRQVTVSSSSSNVSRDVSHSSTAVINRPHVSSNVGASVGRKRPAAAALQTPVVVNMNGGVHTGTRSGGSPAAGRRPVLKMARS